MSLRSSTVMFVCMGYGVVAWMSQRSRSLHDLFQTFHGDCVFQNCLGLWKGEVMEQLRGLVWTYVWHACVPLRYERHHQLSHSAAKRFSYHALMTCMGAVEASTWAPFTCPAVLARAAGPCRITPVCSVEPEMSWFKDTSRRASEPQCAWPHSTSTTGSYPTRPLSWGL